MSRLSWASVLLMALAWSTLSYAQMLTEQEFLEHALTNHPAITGAEAAETAAAGGRRQAGIIDNPVISWEREDPDIALRQDTWRLNWRLPFDGRKHRVAAGDAAVAASSFDLQGTRLGIRLEMRSLFAAWYVADERAAVLQTHLDRTSRLARWLRARAEEGEAAGVEARRLDLEVEVFEREAVAARAEARARRVAAAVWCEVVTNEVRPQRPYLVVPPKVVDAGERPGLKATAHRVAQAEAQHRLQRRVFEPPEISLGWMEVSDGVQAFDGPVLALAWPVPVFDRNQGNRDAAAANVVGARSQLELETRLAEQRARAALATYTDLFPTATPLGVDSADFDVAAAVFAAFEAGEASLTDVLDSLRASVGVQMARLESLDRALAAERELEAAIGRPLTPGGSS